MKVRVIWLKYTNEGGESLKEVKKMSSWGKECKVQMVLLRKTLNDISKETGLSRTYISAIINGRVMAPKDTIEKISQSLEVEDF